MSISGDHGNMLLELQVWSWELGTGKTSKWKVKSPRGGE